MDVVQVAEDNLLECMRASFQASDEHLPPDALAQWICASAWPKSTMKALAIEVLSQVPPGEALDYIDTVQQACSRYESTAFFKTCFTFMKSTHPEWLAAVGQTLTPNLLFGEARGISIIQASHTLASVPGGDWAEYLLAEGGLGNYGGTSEQVQTALAETMTLKRTPLERLRYINEVLDSPNSPAGAGIGNTVIAFLFSRFGECWPNGDATEAIRLANRVLDDDRFRSAAAGQLLYDHSLDSPPGASKLDLQAWRALLEKARKVK